MSDSNASVSPSPRAVIPDLMGCIATVIGYKNCSARHKPGEFQPLRLGWIEEHGGRYLIAFRNYPPPGICVGGAETIELAVEMVRTSARHPSVSRCRCLSKELCTCFDGTITRL